MIYHIIQYYKSNSKSILKTTLTHSSILATTDYISKVAAITLGPMGRNIVIQNHPHKPRITKDGVTVVKHLQFQNRLQDAICTLVKQSVGGTNKFAGDGTTTSTILIGEIVKNCFKQYSIGNNYMSLRKGLEIGRDIAMEFIDNSCRQISKTEDLMKVAMIATNRNHNISELVVKAVASSNKITVEKSSKTQNYIQYYSGIKITRGIPHDYFKNTGNKVVYNYPLIVVTKKPVKNVKQVVKMLQLAKKSRKQLILFSEDISDSVMSTFIYNNKNKTVQACAISIPPYGTKSQQYLQQIAQRTDAYCFHNYSQHQIENIQWQQIGKAIKVEIDQFETLIQAKSTKEDVNSIIFVGGSTQEVRLQAYDKIVDALNSVKTAKTQGVVAGGGLTYWRASQLLQTYQGEGKEGVNVLAKSLKQPRRRLFQSYNPLKAFMGQGWKVYDLNGDNMVDMFEKGVIDSVNVAKNVLIDSVSLASLLIDVNIAIVRSHSNQGTKDYENIVKSIKI